MRMQISIGDASVQLDELVRRAEAGEEIVLTENDRPVAKLVLARPAPSPAEELDARFAAEFGG